MIDPKNLGKEIGKQIVEAVDETADKSLFNENLNKIVNISLYEASLSNVGPDDGPGFMYPNFDSYKKATAEDNKGLLDTGWEIVDYMLDDDQEQELNPPIYPNGPVGSVSYFPSGDIGVTTPTNQEDIYGSEAYDKWKKHVLMMLKSLGYEWVQSSDDENRDKKASVGDAVDIKNQPVKDRTKGTEKAIDLEESMVNEIPMNTLRSIDNYADSQFNPIDMVLTGRHFFDRLQDPRNQKEISQAELIGFFKRLSKKKKEFLDFIKKYGQIVAKDNRTKLNIPFMKQANKVIAKTIMRKDDFKTSNPSFHFEQLAMGMTLRDIAKKHGVDFNDLKKEAKKGVKVEMEHTFDKQVAYNITKDHLFEDPNYYTKLSTIEELYKKYTIESFDGGEAETSYLDAGEVQKLGSFSGRPDPWFEQGGYTQLHFPTADSIYGNDKESLQRKAYIKVKNKKLTTLPKVDNDGIKISDVKNKVTTDTTDKKKTVSVTEQKIPNPSFHFENKDYDKVEFYKQFYTNVTPSGFTVDSEGNTIKIEIPNVLKEEILTLPDSLGIPRNKMPQIKSTLMGDYIRYIDNQNIRVSKKKLPISTLKNSQSELNKDKIQGLLKGAGRKSLEKPFIISSDNYILDGHHRANALYNIDDKYKANVIQINLPIKKLIQLTHDFSKVKYKDIDEDIVYSDSLKNTFGKKKYKN